MIERFLLSRFFGETAFNQGVPGSIPGRPTRFPERFVGSETRLYTRLVQSVRLNDRDWPISRLGSSADGGAAHGERQIMCGAHHMEVHIFSASPHSTGDGASL